MSVLKEKDGKIVYPWMRYLPINRPCSELWRHTCHSNRTHCTGESIMTIKPRRKFIVESQDLSVR
jgi:hypothetical protein